MVKHEKKTRDEQDNTAEIYLYSRLHRKYGDEYVDPFADGPQAMADLIDSYLEFINQTYEGHVLGDIKNLAEFIRSRIEHYEKLSLSKNNENCGSYSGFENSCFESIAEVLRGMPIAGRIKLLSQYSKKTKTIRKNPDDQE